MANTMSIPIFREPARGCGYRVEGFYLRGEWTPWNCLNLPIFLHMCPTCGEGMSHTRGWRKINLQTLTSSLPTPCDPNTSSVRSQLYCGACPFGDASPESAYLLWVGKESYPTPESFINEAQELGISKRIPKTRTGLPSIPDGFQFDETLVCFAHPVAMLQAETPQSFLEVPGIIGAFKPTQIEFVVDSTRVDTGDVEYLEYLSRLHAAAETRENLKFDTVRVEQGASTLERLGVQEYYRTDTPDQLTLDF